MVRGHEPLKKWHARLSADLHAFAAEFRFKPTDQQAVLFDMVMDAVYDRGPRNIAVRSGQGPGKCVGEDVRVDSSLGRMRIKDLVGREFQVPSMNPISHKMEWKSAAAFPSGNKCLNTLRLDSGQRIQLTPDHPLYTPEGWKEAQQIQEGEFVAVPRRLPCGPGLDIKDNEIRFLAYIMSDGSTSGSKVAFSQMRGVVLDEFMEDVHSLGGSVSRYEHRSKALDVFCVKMAPFVRKWGLYGSKATNKRIHPKLFLMSREQISLFINRFWACDGYFTKDGPEITLANEGLVQDLQSLLLRLDIQSRLAFKQATCQGKKFDSWRLKIGGDENRRRWDVAIGTALGKPNKYMVGGVVGNSNVDVVPIKLHEFAEIQDEMSLPNMKGHRIPGVPIRQQIREAGFRGRTHAYMSRNKFKLFCSQFGYKGERAHLASNDLMWAKLVSQESGDVRPVFDLTVDDNASFVAESIIVHNTACSSLIGMWRSFRAFGGRTAVTAPTMRQCREIWIAEARLWLAKASKRMQKYIQSTTTKIEIAGGTVPNWGCQTVTATRPENFQGIHQDNLTVIVEEASGVPRDIMQVIEGTFTNADRLLLLIGNPNTRECFFFDCFNRDRHKWATAVFNAEESPNVDQSNVRDLAEKYGKDSDVYRVRVLGEFPHSDPNCVMSSEDLEKCTDERLRYPCAGASSKKQIGIDLARFGGDESVLYMRQGNAVYHWEHFEHVDPNDVVERAMMLQVDHGWADKDTFFVVDATGMGQGVMRNFYSAGKKLLEFHNHGSPADSKFENKITEAWFGLRELVRTGTCYIPNDNRLIQQLSTRQYAMTKKGKIAIEPKEVYCKRGFDSPDRADALVMAFYSETTVGGRGVATSSSGRSRVVGSRVR